VFFPVVVTDPLEDGLDVLKVQQQWLSTVKTWRVVRVLLVPVFELIEDLLEVIPGCDLVCRVVPIRLFVAVLATEVALHRR